MSRFIKAYSCKDAAREALRRSRWLCAEGLPTPQARQGTRPEWLSFAYCEGATGPALLDTPLTELLRPLGRLHRARQPGLSAHDPLLRIRLRRAALTHPVLIGALDRLSARVETGSALLHGDFHIGQLIRETADRVWIIDLDDLAIGPPEADLANFTAHLATREVDRGALGMQVAVWQTRVLSAWGKLGHRSDAGRFATYLHLALIRRHLKFRELGRPDMEAQLAALLTGAPDRTCACDSATCRG